MWFCRTLFCSTVPSPLGALNDPLSFTQTSRCQTDAAIELLVQPHQRGLDHRDLCLELRGQFYAALGRPLHLTPVLVDGFTERLQGAVHRGSMVPDLERHGREMLFHRGHYVRALCGHFRAHALEMFLERSVSGRLVLREHGNGVGLDTHVVAVPSCFCVVTLCARGPFGSCPASNITASPTLSASNVAPAAMLVAWKK